MTGGMMQNNGENDRCNTTSSISGTVLTIASTSGGCSVHPLQTLTGAGVTAGTYITSFSGGTGGAGTYNINASQSVSSETIKATYQANILVTGAANQGRLHLSNVQFPSVSSSTPDYIVYSTVAPGTDYEIDSGDLFCTGGSGGSGKSYNNSLFNWVLGTPPAILKVRTSGCPWEITGATDFNINSSGGWGLGGNTPSGTLGTFEIGLSGTTAGELIIDGLGGGKLGLLAPSSSFSNFNITLPPNGGSNGNVTITDGTGALSFAPGFNSISSGSLYVSQGTTTPTGVAEVDGDCLVGSGGAWGAHTCVSAHSNTFAIFGTLTVANDQTNWVILPAAGIITKANAVCKTGPTGQALIFDILKSTNNGSSFTSLWNSTPANKIQIAAGQVAGSQTSFDTTTFNAGDLLRIDVDQIGSGVAGGSCTVTLTSSY